MPIFDLLNHVQAGGKGLNCDNGVIGFDLVSYADVIGFSLRSETICGNRTFRLTGQMAGNKNEFRLTENSG